MIVETALKFGGGSVGVEDLDSEEIKTYSEEFACPDHGAFLPEMSPRIFSFNSPLGACPDCQGLGVQKKLSLDLVVDENLSIADGCIRPFQRSMSSSWYRAIMAQTALHYGYDPTIPFKEWDEEGKNLSLIHI